MGIYTQRYLVSYVHRRTPINIISNIFELSPHGYFYARWPGEQKVVVTGVVYTAFSSAVRALVTESLRRGISYIHIRVKL